MDPDAGGHDLRRQAPIRRGPVAAERSDVAAVHGSSHGEGALGGAEVGKAIDRFVRLRNDVELAVAPDDGVELAFADSPALERPGGSAEAHVDDQGLEGYGCLARFGALRRLGQEVHPPQDRVQSPESKTIEHPRKTDVPHRRRHAGETGLDGTVPDHGPGDVGPVSAGIDPQILGLFRGRREQGDPGEVGAADALPVRRDVQVIDVEPRVHDADGNRSAAHAREDPGGAAVSTQRVRAHGRNGRVVSRFDNAHRLHGQHVVRRGDGFHLTVGYVGRIRPQVRIEPAHHGAQVLQRSPPPAVGIVRHQGDEDGRLLLRGRLRQFAGERLRKFPLRRYGAQPVDFRQGNDLLQQGRITGQLGSYQVA